jgi:hypothetical protein
MDLEDKAPRDPPERCRYKNADVSMVTHRPKMA